jgi:3-methyl-2-oxobutanoate hydroxymethyltransferase
MATQKSITVKTLQNMKLIGEKIAMLTCYDASFANMLSTNGVDVLLVGDSLGNVLQGHSSTVPVCIYDMIYHTKCVSKGNKGSMVLVDMPFGTYDNAENAYANAVKLMQAGANMVKIEGADWLSDIVKYLSVRGIPVCAHLGLTPQFVNTLGGYSKQAKTETDAQKLKQDALMLEKNGAALVLFECIPDELAKTVTDALNVPTIGIGAGKDCDGQVLVVYDILGLVEGKSPSFSKNFMHEACDIPNAISRYVNEVKNILN